MRQKEKFWGWGTTIFNELKIHAMDFTGLCVAEASLKAVKKRLQI